MAVKQIATTCDSIIYQVLELQAEAQGKSVSELVREAIYDKINLTNDPMAIAKMMIELHELKTKMSMSSEPRQDSLTDEQRKQLEEVQKKETKSPTTTKAAKEATKTTSKK